MAGRTVPILDPNLPPTGRVGEEQVREALGALQVEGVTKAQMAELAKGPMGPIVYAIVKHFMRDGFTQVWVEDAEPRPSKANPVAQRRRRP